MMRRVAVRLIAQSALAVLGTSTACERSQRATPQDADTTRRMMAVGFRAAYDSIAPPSRSANVAEEPLFRDTTSASIVELSGLITAPIDTMMTLARWRADHPNDSVSLREPEGVAQDFFCRSSSALVVADGTTWLRSAVFMIPAAPPGEALPEDSVRVAETVCRLRAIWLERDELSLERASRLALSLQAALSPALAAPRSPADTSVALEGNGTHSWLNAASWSDSPTYVVLGVAPRFPEIPPGETHLDPAAARPRVVLVKYVAGRGLQPTFDAAWADRNITAVDVADSVAYARADSAIALSGLPALAELPQILPWHTTADAMREPPEPPASLDSILLRAIRAVRDAPSLDGRRRAAALLAVDIYLETHARWLDLERISKASHARRTALEQVGAVYILSPLSVSYIYARNWLWDAYRADSAGPVGRSAFMELLRTGWSTHPTCGDGADLFTRVIEHGERALREGHRDPAIHYYVAQAHQDIVALAAGDVMEYADPKLYIAEAPSARTKAIEHYRRALAGLRPPSLRRGAWMSAVRLLIGRYNRAHYYCVYD